MHTSDCSTSGGSMQLAYRHQRPATATLIAAFLVPIVLVGFTILGRSAVADCFVAVAVVVLVLPPLMSATDGLISRLLVAGTGVASIAIVLLFMPASMQPYVDCLLIVMALAVMIVGAVSLLQAVCNCDAAAVSMTITIALLLWLSWPVWLSGRLIGHERLVNWLATAHPLLAINGQLLDQSIWTERPLMYGWTALNQDVSYSIPTTIFWCVLMHGGIGLSLLFLSSRVKSHRCAGLVVGS